MKPASTRSQHMEPVNNPAFCRYNFWGTFEEPDICEIYPSKKCTLLCLKQSSTPSECHALGKKNNPLILMWGQVGYETIGLLGYSH